MAVQSSSQSNFCCYHDHTISLGSQMAGNQMSTEQLMTFLNTFKESIENTMNAVKTDLSDKIDDKLVKLDKGIETLTAEVRDNDKRQATNLKRVEDKQEEHQKKLEDRLKKLELDANRQKYGRIKQNSKNLDGSTDNTSQQDGRLEERRHRDTPAKDTGEKEKQGNLQDVFQIEDPLHISPNNRITRAASWAEEVERTLPTISPNTAKNDRDQWTNSRRNPSSWAENLNSDVSSAAEMAGRARTRRSVNNPDRPATRKNMKIHECKQDKIRKIHHWFGNSTEEDSSDNEQNEDWNLIDRESRKQARKKRALDRKNRQKAEIALKAKRMAGLGPISDQDIEIQMRKTRNYSQAKIWAVKAHLAQHYRYNQDELDDLDILETKRTNKDDIVYIAMANEIDIKDIYARKAECRSDDTTVKIFIPPQYYNRFSALNRICADKRSRDESLKTQIRFGDKDLMILTKEKGSQEPFYSEDLESFIDGEELPEVDMSIKWRFHEDRPPRRRVATPPPATTTSLLSSPADRQASTRQLSTSSTNSTTVSKRQKLANQPLGFPANQKNDMDMTL